ncbi:MAG: TonB-dependent receptor plug domain-containing protein, partial [Chitinophagaceae bacterium]|nr:TonB-dependent receptor plug domain-containing protein [Chitinophagaceae bacterium]
MKLLYNRYLFLTSLLSLGLTGYTIAQSPVNKDPLQPNEVNPQTINRDVRHIGFDTQDPAIVTSAISTVKGNSLLTIFNTNLANKLYGRLAGLTVSQGGNEPGFNSPSLLARGRNTYQSSDASPLVIIDGFLGNFEQLVPEEIEEISLLKDASATAVYGFRGANGVLLVTTKRGKQGPLSVSFSALGGFSQAISLPKTLNSFQYATLYNEASVNDGRAPLYSSTALEAYQTKSNPVLYPDVNWYDQVLRKTAPVSNYNLSFTGGTSNVRYFVTLNAVGNQGLYQKFGDRDPESSNSTYNRYNLRSNVDINITDRFSASLLIGGSVEDKFNPYQISTGGVFNSISLLPPNAFPIRIPNGSSENIRTLTPNGEINRIIPVADGSYSVDFT